MSFRLLWRVLGTQQVLNKCRVDSMQGPPDQNLAPKSVIPPLYVEWGVGHGKKEQVRASLSLWP